MRSFLTKAVPIVTLAMFICIMLSGRFMKKPFGYNDNVPKHISKIIQAVEMEDWEEARDEIEPLERAWGKVVKRIQFSSERDEIDKLSVNIARLHGAIQAQDKSDALMELNEARHHWISTGN